MAVLSVHFILGIEYACSDTGSNECTNGIKGIHNTERKDYDQHHRQSSNIGEQTHNTAFLKNSKESSRKSLTRLRKADRLSEVGYTERNIDAFQSKSGLERAFFDLGKSRGKNYILKRIVQTEGILADADNVGGNGNALQTAATKECILANGGNAGCNRNILQVFTEFKCPAANIFNAFFKVIPPGKSYIIKAGTVILVCNTVVQIMQTFNWKLQIVAEGAENTSIPLWMLYL